MRDIVLVTVECLRRDRAGSLAPDLNGPHDCLTAAHYTRPTLAGLLSGRVSAAARAACETPTLPAHLSEHGYATIGVSHSPQTVPGLGFAEGFGEFLHAPGGGGRGSHWREWLGQFRPVRRIHRRLRPKAATLEAVPSDVRAVEAALAAYQNATAPRFLWVHLMDTHRPYGRAEERLPEAVSRRAASAAPGRLAPSLDATAAQTVRQHYDAAVRRTQRALGRLLDGVDTDAAVVVCGDHGEELGEHGVWFHGPYRRRTVDTLTRVPLWTRNVDVGGGLARQVDIPTTLARGVGLEAAAQWTGTALGEADSALTVAPWAGSVAARYRDGSGSVDLDGASVSGVETATVDADVRQRLAALGYR